MPLAQPIGLGPLPYNLPADMAAWVAYMITYGWMEAAPTPAASTGGIEFEDREGIEWADTEGIEHEDR